MTAYTHVAFASSMAILFNYLDFKSIFIICIASLIPDLDTKHSLVSILLYPFHKILNLLGVKHRTYTHSFFLYLMFIILGAKLFNPLLLIGFGAMTHIIIDCFNKSGVPLFLPLSDKICIFTSRKYRLRSGAKEEVYLIVTFILIGYGFYNININGGSRAYLLKYLNNYQFTYNQYLATAEKVSYLEAKVRYKSTQSIEEKNFLIVCATDSSRELYVYDEETEEIYSTTKDLTVLKGNLKPTNQHWKHIFLGEIQKLKSSNGFVFQRTGKNVRKVEDGEYLAKDIFYLNSIQLE